MGTFVGSHVQHRRPHDGPDESKHGQYEETTLVRHQRYGQPTENVTEKSSEHCAGEHERRVQASFRLGYDLPCHGTAARARRAKRAPGQQYRAYWLGSRFSDLYLHVGAIS